MKIALLAHSLHPTAEPFAGGLEKIVHLLSKELTDLGHEVHLYGHPESKGDFILKPFRSLKIRNAENGFEEMDDEYQEEIYREAIAKIKAGDYDIVHNHSLNEAAIILGNELEVPFITTCHTPPFESLQKGVKNLNGNINQTFTMVSQSLGITWSPLVRDYNVIHNGIDLAQWTFEPAVNDNTAFWCGRICKEKAPHHAILAAKASNIKLRIAGSISNAEYFEEHVKPLLDNDIVYIGHLSQAELNREIGKSAFLYFTSVWDEPYGLVMAESLACGTPIIGYKSGAAPEIVTDDCGTLVEVGNWKALAEASSTAHRHHRKNCRSRAIEFCSSKKMAYGYQALYNKLKRKHNTENLIAI